MSIDFKNACKALTLSLKEQGITLPHSKVLDIVAKSQGYKDYQTYIGVQNDYSRIQGFRTYKLVIDFDGDKTVGNQIYNMIMEYANRYYKQASRSLLFKDTKVLPSYPVPTLEHSKNRIILIWKSGPNGFGENTYIGFTLPIVASSMYRDNKALFMKMKDIRLIENKVENNSCNSILTEVPRIASIPIYSNNSNNKRKLA